MEGSPSYRELPIGRVERLARTLDDWFSDHHRIAVETIKYVVEVKQDSARESGVPLQLRQLFRNPANYEAFMRRQDTLIQDRWPTSGKGLAVA